LLVCEDLRAAHDFLVEAFGFTSGFVHADEKGDAVHAEVRAGETTIWLHRATAEHHLASPRKLGEVGSGGLVIHVDDVDAHYQRVRAAAAKTGAKIDSEPSDKPYGQRDYGVRDLEGHRWWFATPAVLVVPSVEL
jgi:uncharacterized glyoxalase superfamily protein PhnB